jgi:cohesin loading factor subunit SCC2
MKKVELPYLLFIADNLSSFPYAVLDEPLFVIHVVDKVASGRGSTILEQLNEVK